MKLNLDLKNKFNLLLVLIFFVGVFLSGLVLSKMLYQQAERKVTDEGQILMRIMEEVKYYTSVHLLSAYQQNDTDESGFKVSIVPAYAAREVFANFKDMDKFENYKYKEATENPTNLADKPNLFEADLISTFKLKKDLKVLSGYTKKYNQSFYYISRPLSVNNESCLQCHSSPKIAPPKMIEIYGDQHGFNWELGQLTSAQTIYVPAQNIASTVRMGMFTFMPMFTGVFAILILSINRLLQHTVINPINQLTNVAKHVSLSEFDIKYYWRLDYLERLTQRNDEPGNLAKAFLTMSEKIFSREQDLQKAVVASTRELREEIKERSIIEQKLAKQVDRALIQEQITQKIRQSLDIDQILQTAVNNIGKAFQVSRCQIYSYIEDQPRLAKVIAEYIVPEYPVTLGATISLDEAVCLNCAMSREKSVHWSYVRDTPFLHPSRHIYEQLEINSLMTVRTSYKGEVNGAISIQQCDRPRQWRSDEVDLMESVAAQVGIALAQAKLLQQEKQRRQEIEAAKQEAETANRSKSEFLANISHELRTPLNAIIGFSQLMGRDSNTTPAQKENISIINRSGAHLLEMINEVLEMSKIEAGRVDLNTHSVDLTQLIKTLGEMLEIKAKQKNLQLMIEVATDVPQYILTDESKLRQILTNLIDNAIKFTKVGCVSLDVVSKEIDSSGRCVLNFSVKDTGLGIEDEELTKIFQAFGQSETGRQSKQGTGLGLSISKKYVELMGGNLTVDSKVGQGSVFEFNIVTKLSDLCPSDLSEVKTVTSLAPNQLKYRILAVDDVWQSRLLIVNLLTQIGFEVREAENGHQAIEIAQEWQPHLILMDMRMPIMDGYESTKEIRSREQSDRSTVIIALTASAFQSKRAKTIKAGCDDYLTKPFQENELLTKIQKHLGVKYLYQEDSETKRKQSPSLSSESFSLTPESLKVMQLDWLQAFKQASTELDEAKLERLIQQIPTEHSYLSEPLQDLVTNLQFETIIKLIGQ